MPRASGARRLRVLLSLCLAVAAFCAVTAQPAAADTRVVNGGETRMQVNVAAFVKLLGDGIFITPIEPAKLEFGSSPAAIFPVDAGVADPVLRTTTVHHQGGLRVAKDSINFSVDVTNLTTVCANAGTIALGGCRIVTTANNVLPNELAEIRDFTITDDDAGTVTLQGRAVVSQVTALAMNTLFQTNVFQPGMELGTITSSFKYLPLT